MAMAKKSNRLVPSMVINVEGEGKASADMLCESDVFVEAVFFETIEGIQDAIKAAGFEPRLRTQTYTYRMLSADVEQQVIGY